MGIRTRFSSLGVTNNKNNDSPITITFTQPIKASITVNYILIETFPYVITPKIGETITIIFCNTVGQHGCGMYKNGQFHYMTASRVITYKVRKTNQGLEFYKVSSSGDEYYDFTVTKTEGGVELTAMGGD